MRWRCCFAECLAMCAWCACLNTVLRCPADACLLVPIFADHVGGLHVAMRFEWCVQAFPSGHVGPLATAGNKRWELREGTAKRGGRWHGRSSSQEVEVCLVHVMCYTCVGAPLQASRVSLLHSSLAPAWLLSRGSQELGRSTASLRLHACVWGFYSISAEYLFWRDCPLRAPNITLALASEHIPYALESALTCHWNDPSEVYPGCAAPSFHGTFVSPPFRPLIGLIHAAVIPAVD